MRLAPIRRPAIGLDLGGTKIEAVLLAPDGRACWRERVASPSTDYLLMIEAIAALVDQGRAASAAIGLPGMPSLGLGIPGTALPDGRIKNANTRCLNGRPLATDLEARLGQPVRLANDANCLALSEATDGAGLGASVVFAAILGTGTGAGIAIDGKTWEGPHRIAGEWGHNPLPWPTIEEVSGASPCFCGKRGCIETWVSGTGFRNDFMRISGRSLDGPAIIAAAKAGDDEAMAALERYTNRLGRSLAHVVTLLDPDVIVLGGGMSNVELVYEGLESTIGNLIFSDRFITPIRPALHGDSSGVRGAAWLWGR